MFYLIGKTLVWSHIFSPTDLEYTDTEGWVKGRLVSGFLKNNYEISQDYFNKHESIPSDEYISLPYEEYPPGEEFWIDDERFYVYNYYSYFNRVFYIEPFFAQGPHRYYIASTIKCYDINYGFIENILYVEEYYKLYGEVPLINRTGEQETDMTGQFLTFLKRTRYIRFYMNESNAETFSYPHFFEIYMIGVGIKIYKFLYSIVPPKKKGNFFFFFQRRPYSLGRNEQ